MVWRIRGMDSACRNAGRPLPGPMAGVILECRPAREVGFAVLGGACVSGFAVERDVYARALLCPDIFVMVHVPDRIGC